MIRSLFFVPSRFADHFVDRPLTPPSADCRTAACDRNPADIILAIGPQSLAMHDCQRTNSLIAFILVF